MYLDKKIYVLNWGHSPEKHEIIVKFNNEIRKDINSANIKYIIEEVGYWRKFNALHNWFVINCSDTGEDDCKDIYLFENNIKDLIKILKTIDKDNSKAEELLPTKSGFFFGGTEYDDFYFSEIKRTLKILTDLKKVIGKKTGYPQLIYHASW